MTLHLPETLTADRGAVVLLFLLFDIRVLAVLFTFHKALLYMASAFRAMGEVGSWELSRTRAGRQSLCFTAFFLAALRLAARTSLSLGGLGFVRPCAKGISFLILRWIRLLLAVFTRRHGSGWVR